MEGLGWQVALEDLGDLESRFLLEVLLVLEVPTALVALLGPSPQVVPSRLLVPGVLEDQLVQLGLEDQPVLASPVVLAAPLLLCVL